MTSNNDDISEINLKTDAEGQYPDWSIKIESLAGSKAQKVHGEDGLLTVGIGMTTFAWNREHPGEDRPAAWIKPVLVVPATVAEREAFKLASDEWCIHIDSIVELKAEIIGDLSPALKKATWDANTGHRNRSITYFLDFLRVRYGAASVLNLDKLKKLIAALWTSESDLEAKFELYKGYHAKLVTLNQPRCESDKLEIFEVVTATLTNVVYYVKRYYEANLDINDRTLAGAMDFILEKQLAGLFTTESNGWVGGASSDTTSSEAAIQRRIDAAVKAERQKHTGKKGDRIPSWCFKHGVGHPGTGCNYMAAYPKFFTEEFRNATHECTIKGLKSHPNPNVFPA